MLPSVIQGSVALSIGVLLLLCGMMRHSGRGFLAVMSFKDPLEEKARATDFGFAREEPDGSRPDHGADTDNGADTDTDSLHSDLSKDDDDDILCLRCLIRARTPASGGPCCYNGWSSCSIGLSRSFGSEWRRHRLPRPVWDCGMCVMMQLMIGSVVLIITMAYIWWLSLANTSYGKLEAHFDRTWGFALRDGYQYTAPVWMGEFGAGARGDYWLNFIRYLSNRDVDWAYWPLNPDKYVDGSFDEFGKWQPFETPQLQNDSYGVLASDYYSIQIPWRLLDLQALTASPASWVPNEGPCDRQVLGSACGG